MTDIFTQKQIKFASFNSRLFANIIDLSLFMFFLAPINRLIKSIIYQDNNPQLFIQNLIKQLEKNKETKFNDFIDNNPQIYQYFIDNQILLKMAYENIIYLIIIISLIFLFLLKFQTTPGKWLVSIKVVDQYTMNKPTKSQLLIRCMSMIISALPLLFGFLWQLFNHNKQTWHDLLAKTIVIKR